MFMSCFSLDTEQAVSKIFDSDDEDIGHLSDASSNSTVSSVSSNKSSKTKKQKKTSLKETNVKLVDKENLGNLKLSIVIEKSPGGDEKYASRRKSCIPNLTVIKTERGFVKKPPEVVRVTRSGIKSKEPVTPKNAAIIKKEYSSDSDDNSSVLSYVTKSGRKSKAVLAQEPMNASKDTSMEDDGDSDFQNEEQNESESDDEEDNEDDDEIKSDENSASDFEVGYPYFQ